MESIMGILCSENKYAKRVRRDSASWRNLIAALVVQSCFIAGAHAASITFAFEGTVDGVLFDAGTPTEFAFGSVVSGSFTFDSTDTDSNASPNNGYYLGAISSYSFTVGTFSQSLSNGNILVRDNVPVQDVYSVEGYVGGAGGSVLGTPLDFVTLSLNDSTGTVFSNDSLLLVPPDLADFDSKTFTLDFLDFDTGDSGQVVASITSLTAVPVPAAIWLFGSALGLMGWIRRKKPV